MTVVLLGRVRMWRRRGLLRARTRLLPDKLLYFRSRMRIENVSAEQVATDAEWMQMFQLSASLCVYVMSCGRACTATMHTATGCSDSECHSTQACVSRTHINIQGGQLLRDLQVHEESSKASMTCGGAEAMSSH